MVFRATAIPDVVMLAAGLGVIEGEGVGVFENDTMTVLVPGTNGISDDVGVGVGVGVVEGMGVDVVVFKGADDVGGIGGKGGEHRGGRVLR